MDLRIDPESHVGHGLRAAGAVRGVAVGAAVGGRGAAEVGEAVVGVAHPRELRAGVVAAGVAEREVVPPEVELVHPLRAGAEVAVHLHHAADAVEQAGGRGSGRRALGGGGRVVFRGGRGGHVDARGVDGGGGCGRRVLRGVLGERGGRESGDDYGENGRRRTAHGPPGT